MGKHLVYELLIIAVIIILLPLVTCVDEFPKYRVGEPIKTFVTAERNVFCEKQRQLSQNANQSTPPIKHS